MATIITRAGKGSALTNAEVDANFTNLNTELLTKLVSSDLGAYLTSASAASTYQTQAGMSSYLTTATAASTYQTQSGMSSYLTTSAASSTYLTQSSAATTYQTALVSGTSIKTINGTSLLGSGNISITSGVSSFNTRTGAITLTSSDVTTALTFTPYDAANPSGYITSSALSGYLTSATAASTYQTQSGMSAYQPTLVSGTNLKSINGSSLLGSGNLSVSGGISYSVKTANYSIANKEGVIADTSGGAFTITLPATPSAGDQVFIADGANWAVNNLTVARNGSTIEGLAENLVLDMNGVSVQLIYSGTTWQVYAQAGVTDVRPIVETATTISSSITLATGKNGFSVGPVTIASGGSVTVPAGQGWLVTNTTPTAGNIATTGKAVAMAMVFGG